MLEVAEMPNSQQAAEGDHNEGDQGGSQLGGLELHVGELNKKPRATQGCSGLKGKVLTR
jgi:hypothetical protein